MLVDAFQAPYDTCMREPKEERPIQLHATTLIRLLTRKCCCDGMCFRQVGVLYNNN